MKKQSFNQELYNKVVKNTEMLLDKVVTQNAVFNNGVNDIKQSYQMTLKANPGSTDVDVLDDFVVQMNILWTQQGMPKESMMVFWYKCGEKFLKSYVQHFIQSK